MLILSRKRGESINIGYEITVTIVDVQGQIVRLGISAPPTITVLRKEIAHRYPMKPLPMKRKKLLGIF